MDLKENKVEDLERVYTDVNSEPIHISYAVVKAITKDFAQVIGHGAFGVVYLGALRNGLVAVKKLSPSKDFSDTQFLVEVKCLKRIKHKNIVRFLGYCADTQGIVMEIGGKLEIGDVQQRFLCFEYVPNGSLDYYLQENFHGYEWNIRYQIMKGICQGLHYLHQLRIYHLDLKPANVILGAQMEPKITDFGLSRCIDGNQSTIFTMNVQGTPGYIAPELIDERKISLKSDIFSLGIIMTRLLIGNRQNIPENWHELLNVDCEQMKKCIEIAQICAYHDPSKRPSISDIICQLDETETTIQKVPHLVVSEPRHDPATTLYQVVNRFRTLPTHTPGEYHRSPDKLPVERPKWKLGFQSPPKLPIYTGEKIKDINGNPLVVFLVDAETSEPSALPNVLQIELVPVLGNFPGDCWDADDFQRGVLEDHEGHRPLLAGERRLIMWDGRTTFNEFMFTDDSQKCGCMLRIGVRVLPGSYQGPRILEAMTAAFMVKDRHGDELHYIKYYKWQLAFQSQPRLPIYIGSRIRDVIGNPLEIILVDMETGSPLVLPMEMDIKLVSLIGASLPLDWTVMDPRLVKGQLSGDVRVTMRDGRVTVNELQFTDNLQLFNEFRIGVCVEPGGYNGPRRILEGMTKAFRVHDIPTEMTKKQYPPALDDEVWKLEGISWKGVFHKRLIQNNIWSVRDFVRMLAVKPDELSTIMGDSKENDGTWEDITSHAWTCTVPTDMTKKNYPPALGDEVWRLDYISWGGVFHKRLTQNNIRNVQDFLRMLTLKPDKLRAIMDDDMEDDIIWNAITSHARTCVVPLDKAYAYRAAHATVYVNSIFDLGKVDFGGAECPLWQLDEAQKRLLQQVTWEAYEHRHSLQEVQLTLKLAFKSPPQLPIYTGSRITDAMGNPLEIILVDAKTGSQWVPPMELNIQLVPLLGDFPLDDDKEHWSAEEFRTAIVKQRQENVPLLKSCFKDNCFVMANGRIIIEHLLLFTDNSSLVRCGKFRIGACFVPGGNYDSSVRILEAMTEEFVVGDWKHYPPVLADPVWRLEMIDKDGEFHRKLTSNNVDTVQDFCRMLQIQPDELRAILGDSMTDLLWKITTDHASTCDPGDKMYAYIGENGTIYVDSLFGRLAIVIDGVECQLKLEQLDNAQQILVLELILEAYEQRHNLQAMELRDQETIDPFLLLDRARRKISIGLPVPSDEVWMLSGITWGGVLHKRLRQNNVRNVQDFLRMLAVKSDELRMIMGDGVENDSTWEKITNHARTWVNPGVKVYAYHSTVHATVYVNSVFHLVKAEFGNVECPLQQLDEVQKRLVQQAMQEAYEHRHSLEEVKLTLKLVFKSQPRLPIHAGSRIEDATGSPLEVILVDAKTGSPWALPIKLDIQLVPLSGDFPPYEDWSADEFQKAIVKPRQVVSLLKGSFHYKSMTDGCFTANKLLQFTDDSSWVPCRKFRIGACVIPRNRYPGFDRILEAMSEAFVVEDLNQKHYPPALGDPIWRLEMIDKDGPAHRNLTSINIDTVQEYQRMRNVKPDELRAIVGHHITDEMWEMTTDHAWECAPGDKVYAYSGENGTIYVDSIFNEVFKLEINGVKCPLEQDLDMAQTMLARQLILEAYEHRHNLQEVDDAEMKLRDHHTSDINELLYRAEFCERQKHVKLDSQAQPLVDKDEDPATQAANLGHPGPSQTESSSVS